MDSPGVYLLATFTFTFYSYLALSQKPSQNTIETEVYQNKLQVLDSVCQQGQADLLDCIGEETCHSSSQVMYTKIWSLTHSSNLDVVKAKNLQENLYLDAKKVLAEIYRLDKMTDKIS